MPVGYNNYIKKPALGGILFLFFLWGGLMCLNITLFPYLEKLFALKTSTYFNFYTVFFGIFFIMAIPAALFIRLFNFKISIMLGLFISGIGTTLFVFASKYISFSLFIAGVIIVASGITIIQVAANTYIGLLGELHAAAGRLSLAHAISAAGYVFILIFTINPVFTSYESIVNNAKIIQQPYLIIALLIMLMLLLYTQLRFPKLTDQRSKLWFTGRSAFYLSLTGIFLYSGAEIIIIRLIQDSQQGIHSSAFISIMLLAYWAGMMTGRLLGFLLFQRFSPLLILLINGLTAIIIFIAALFDISGNTLWFLLPTGLLNGIIFPVLFASGLQQAKNLSYFDGALLIMAVSGGAIIPMFYNYFSALYGEWMSLIIILICYLIIAIITFIQSKIPSPADPKLALNRK